MLGHSNRRVAVLFLDIDDFADLNDRLGRERADEVLVMLVGDQAVELRVSTGTALSEGGEHAGELLNLAHRDMLGRRAARSPG